VSEEQKKKSPQKQQKRNRDAFFLQLGSFCTVGRIFTHLFFFFPFLSVVCGAVQKPGYFFSFFFLSSERNTYTSASLPLPPNEPSATPRKKKKKIQKQTQAMFGPKEKDAKDRLRTGSNFKPEILPRFLTIEVWNFFFLFFFFSLF
jgi:hypothetical protein